MATQTIYAERLSLVRSRLADLNKRAVKLGMPELILTAGAPYARKLENCEHTRTVWVCDVSLDGAIPKINGFTFLASLEHTEAGNLVLKAPGAHDRELTGWQQCSPRCQHCGYDRNRKSTFLLESPDGGIVQVGRSCLADYVRSSDVENTLRWFAIVSEAMGEIDEERFGGGHRPAPTILEYVAAAVSSVRIRGFHKSGCEGTSTRTECDFLTADPPTGGSRDQKAAREEWIKGQPSDAQVAEAAVMITWCLATTDNSDYMHSLRVACGCREVNDRARGILASLPACYDRAMGIERARKERTPNGPHYGAIGDKFDAAVEVIYARGFEGFQGQPGTMLIMRDTAGHVFQWFGTGSINDVEDFKGQWFLRATVKRHDHSKKTGEPITTLTRCKLSRAAFKPVKTKRARAIEVAA